MKISNKGLNLIKEFEGLRLKAYKPVPTEKLWTIGYGHYGVEEGSTCTQSQAEEYLRQDVSSSERAVNNLKRQWTQGQFDALVSFTYNCGTGNLKTLCANRPADIIADKILLYNKAGGKVLNGLVRRRQAERELFLS